MHQRQHHLPYTPACAGLTWSGSQRRGSSGLYPRVRGADVLGQLISVVIGPLPPRARG